MSDLTATLQGSLTIAPSANTPPTDQSSGGASYGLSLQTENASAQSEAGQTRSTINSPSVFFPLALPSNQLSRVLYIRQRGNQPAAPIQVQVTFATSGVAVLPVRGTLLLEAPPGDEITGVAIQGQSIIEWTAFGSLNN